MAKLGDMLINEGLITPDQLQEALSIQSRKKSFLGETLITEKYITEDGPIDFVHITPKDYYVRVIYDENKNGKWDSGNFLKGIQPERVSYMKGFIEARANWSPQEVFTLD